MEYKYCPKCGNELRIRIENGIERLFCQVCNHFIYKNPVPVVAGIILDSKKRILLVKRGIEPCKGEWSLPSGFIEIDETPEQCVLREMKEETGLECRKERLFGVYQQKGWRYSSIIILAYILNITGGEAKAGDDAADLCFYAYQDIPEIPFISHRKIIKDIFSE